MENRDHYWMGLALELASRGRGRVEPNPMVGCVIVEKSELIASGYHHAFGEPHAEVMALRQCDRNRIANATVYVTLEPCSHHGKTPPCVNLFVENRPKRIVIAMLDPFPLVSGRGVQALREQSIDVKVGILESKARALNAPYLKLLRLGLPWVIAKWAMTLDGAIATREKDSKWISNELSRKLVHRLRARVDAVLVGIGTVLADDPLLNARFDDHANPCRTAKRVVLDRQCRLPLDSKLVRSLERGPVVVAVSQGADSNRVKGLAKAGCEMILIPAEQEAQSLRFVLNELGKQRQTNVLLEGGGQLLGHAFDSGLVDEVCCFIAPKIVGGERALRPVAGFGKSRMADCLKLNDVIVESLGDDVCIQGVMAPLN